MRAKPTGRAGRLLTTAATIGALTTGALAVTLPSASAAAGGTITYVKGNDVWVAAADGGRARRVTTTGTTASPWRSPTESDDGHIVAGRGSLIYRMDQWGTVLDVLDPPSLPNSAGELLGGAPAHLAVSPDGSKIAYTYEKYSCPVNLSCRIRYVTAFTSSTRVTDPSTWGVTYYDNPSWITNSRVAVNADLIDNINLFDLARGETFWFDEDDYTTDDQPLFDFEVARHASYATAIRNSGDRAHVVFYRVSGNYVNGGRPPIPEGLCATTPGVGISTPTLSADGALGAWREPDGIWMMPLGSSPCTTQPVLVIPGGSAPSYSPATLQSTRPTYSFSVRTTPKIRGTVRVGKKVTATAPSLNPVATGTKYQWLRDGRAVKGATRAAYKITARDRGHALRVRATSTRQGFRAKVTLSGVVRVKR